MHTPAALFVLGLLALWPALPQAREASGTIALANGDIPPEGSELTLRLLAPDGTDQATTEPATPSPQPFRLTAPPAPGLLQARMRAPQGQTWLSDPIHLPPGAQDIALGTLVLRPNTRIETAQWFACGPALVQIGLVGNDTLIQRGDTLAKLKQIAPTGDRQFSDGRSIATTLNKPSMTMVWQGAPLPPCTPFPDPAGAPVPLRGSDPAWQAVLSPDGAQFSRADGSGGQATSLIAHTHGDRVTWHSPGLPPFTLSPGPCLDAETALPYPATASLDVDPPLTGCAGHPHDLIQGDWRLEQIDGASLPGGTSITLSLNGSHFSGQSGCNRYSGTLLPAGAELRFGPVALTRMACAPDRMALETQFLDHLARSTGFALTGATMTLMADGDSIALFTRP